MTLRFNFESKIRSQSTYSKSGRSSLMLKTQQTSSQLEALAKTELPPDHRWTAILARDETKDGVFVFGVRSTGIYCKPSCPARHPQIEQVVFFHRPEEAEQSGFRACKRCHPREGPTPRTELIQRICLFIDRHLDEKLTLSTLSREAGLSSFHFQRVFKKVLSVHF